MKRTLKRRARYYLRGLGFRIAYSVQFLRRLYDTPPADRELMKPARPLRMPACWLRGHTYDGQALLITSSRFTHCARCGEEIIGRTRWSDLTSRPEDHDLVEPRFYEDGFV